MERRKAGAGLRLRDFETKIRLRPIVLVDYEALVTMQKSCFPGMTPWSRDQIESQVRIFPEGQLCIELDGRIVASSNSLIVDYDRYEDWHDWGRIAAANALSDVYAMGGTPLMAINLVAWPRELLPTELLREVLRGGLDIATEAGCPVLGGHSIDAPEPLYGMAVTGTADPDRLMCNDAAEAGLPISLTKPLGVGVLNNRHKSTGETSQEAIASMVTLNRDAAQAALAAGVRAATDVTGFGSAFVDKAVELR